MGNRRGGGEVIEKFGENSEYCQEASYIVKERSMQVEE